MKRMLGSLQRRKKQATRNDASLFTPSTSNHKDASPIPSSHARRKLKVELDSSELTKDKPQRRRRTRIRDAMHEFVESDVSSTHGSENAFDVREVEGEKTTSNENIDEHSGVGSKETDDLDDSKPMWRSDMKDSDVSDEESDHRDNKLDLATKTNDADEGKLADAPTSTRNETKGGDYGDSMVQQEFDVNQVSKNRVPPSEGKSFERGRKQSIMTVIVNGKLPVRKQVNCIFIIVKPARRSGICPKMGSLSILKISQNCSNLFQSQGHKKAVDVSKMEFEKMLWRFPTRMAVLRLPT